MKLLSYIYLYVIIGGLNILPILANPILFTSELEGHLAPCSTCAQKRGGVSKRHTLIEAMRKEHPDLILIDTGNAFMGRDSLLTKGMRMADALVLHQYDVMILGHGDFVEGSAHATKLFQKTKAQIVSANLAVQGLNIRPFYKKGDTVIIGLTEIPKGLNYLPAWKKILTSITYKEPKLALTEVLLNPEVAGASSRILVFNGSKATFARQLLKHPEIKKFNHIIVAGDKYENKTTEKLGVRFSAIEKHGVQLGMITQKGFKTISVTRDTEQATALLAYESPEKPDEQTVEKIAKINKTVISEDLLIELPKKDAEVTVKPTPTPIPVSEPYDPSLRKVPSLPKALPMPAVSQRWEAVEAQLKAIDLFTLDHGNFNHEVKKPILWSDKTKVLANAIEKKHANDEILFNFSAEEAKNIHHFLVQSNDKTHKFRAYLYQGKKHLLMIKSTDGIASLRFVGLPEGDYRLVINSRQADLQYRVQLLRSELKRVNGFAYAPNMVYKLMSYWPKCKETGENEFFIEGSTFAKDYDYFSLDISSEEDLLYRAELKGATMLELIHYLPSEGLVRRAKVTDGKATIEKIKLSKGRNYFAVRASKSGDYAVRIKGFPSPDPLVELEPNDSLHTATFLQPNQARTGEYHPQNRVDCYGLALKGSSLVQLSLSASKHMGYGIEFYTEKVAKNLDQLAAGKTNSHFLQLEKGFHVCRFYPLDKKKEATYTIIYRLLNPYTVIGKDESLTVPKDPFLSASFKLESSKAAAFSEYSQSIPCNLVITNSGAERVLNLESQTSHQRITLKFDQTDVVVPEKGTLTIMGVLEILPNSNTSTMLPLAIGLRDSKKDKKVVHSVSTPFSLDPQLFPLVSPKPIYQVPAPLLGTLNMNRADLGAKDITKYSDEGGVSKSLKYVFSDRIPSPFVSYSNNYWQLKSKENPTIEYPENYTFVGTTLTQFPEDNTAEGVKEFAIEVSQDGKSYTRVLTASLRRQYEEHYFVFEKPITAKFARLVPLSGMNPENVGIVTLPIWGMLAEPSTQPNKPIDLVAMSNQGSPKFKVDSGICWNDLQDAFCLNLPTHRAAKLSALEWTDNGKTKRSHLYPLKVSYSLESAGGPWIALGTWDLNKINKEGVSRFPLPADTWIRYVKIEVSKEVKARDRAKWLRRLAKLPFKMIEQSPSNTYRSCLGSWGYSERRGPYEFFNPPAAPKAVVGKKSRQSDAVTLSASDSQDGVVSIDKDWNRWYQFTAPHSGAAYIKLANSNKLIATLEVVLKDGSPADYAVTTSSKTSTTWALKIDKGQSYWIHVREPKRNIVFVWDNSGSMSNYRKIGHIGMETFCSAVNPKTERVHLLPQRSVPETIFKEWSSDPWQLRSGLQTYMDANSSDSTLNMMKAVSLLENCSGSKAIILIGDFEDGSGIDLKKLGPLLAQEMPMVFGFHKVNTTHGTTVAKMRNVASYGGHYSSFKDTGELSAAFELARSRIRRPSVFSIALKLDTKLPKHAIPPKPGSLEVVLDEKAKRNLGKSSGQAIEIILDASGSMLRRTKNGKRRIQIAREVLQDLVSESIPPGTPVALRVFGHRTPGSCESILEIPLSPLNPRKVSRFIGTINAQNLAKTPIGDSLDAVAKDLGTFQGKTTVILLTDGEETCGGDPEASIKKLRKSGIDVKVNIVGFAIDQKQLKADFTKWAMMGGGSYFDANSKASLAKSMQASVMPEFHVLNEKNIIVAKGIANGQKLSLLPGKYTLELQTKPKRFIKKFEMKELISKKYKVSEFK